MRPALQCLTAAFASLLVPLAGALCIRSLPGAPIVKCDGSIDDAPDRAAMVFLIFSPVLLAFLGTFFAGSAALLRRARHLSLGRLYLVNAFVSLLVALTLARDGYSAFGARHAAISFVLFGSLTFVSLGLGSTAWWSLQPGIGPRS